MRLKCFLLVMLFLTSIVFSAVPAMAQINQQPQVDPVLLTQELRSVVESVDGELLRGFVITYTDQLRSALVKKIDDVIMMFENGNFQGGYKKLDNDIAPKLWICDTNREQARSWLSNDPAMRDRVEVFRDNCQNLIHLIKLADPRPTP
jgi:hypothetical protein